MPICDSSKAVNRKTAVLDTHTCVSHTKPAEEAWSGLDTGVFRLFNETRPQRLNDPPHSDNILHDTHTWASLNSGK